MDKNNTAAFDSMKNLFPVSKTLAFNLIPVGDTYKNMIKNDVFKIAQQQHNDYETLKAACDRLHRDFIDRVLIPFRLKYHSTAESDSIQEYVAAFLTEIKKDDAAGREKREKALEKIASNLKKSIEGAFEAHKYGNENMLNLLKSQNLLKKILPEEELSEEEQAALKRMMNYTTFFRDYFETRDRMYRAKQNGITIPNRIIEDNLPVHIGNIHRFAELPQEIKDGIKPLVGQYALQLQADMPEDVFCASYFSLLCSQNSIDTYNLIIGGKSLEDGTKIQGLNELINLYNQKRGTEVKQFKKLKKQILSEGRSFSFIPEAMKEDKEVVDAMEAINKEHLKLAASIQGVGCVDLTKVYVSAGEGLTSFSLKIYGRWNLAGRCLANAFADANPPKTGKMTKSHAENVSKLFKKIKYFSVAEIADAVTKYSEGGFEEKNFASFIDEYIHKPLVTLSATHDAYTKSYENDPAQKLGEDSSEAGKKIKVYLDTLMDVCKTLHCFTDENGTLSRDERFYLDYVEPFEEFGEMLIPAYNKIRNYLTKKPYSTDKLELTFSNPTLMGGWDINKISTNRTVILREGDDLYLGVLPKGVNNIFDDMPQSNSSTMKRMNFKLIAGAAKALAKVGFQGKDPAAIPPVAYNAYIREKDKDKRTYSHEEESALIDYYKTVIRNNRDWDILNIQLKETVEYPTLGSFYEDVDRQCYVLRYEGISRSGIEKAVEQGALYLFRISCQDMLAAHHGKDGNYKNLLYAALSEDKSLRVRLCGMGTIYRREASIKRHITHPAGVPMTNKNPDAQTPTRTLHYDLIKDRRFTEERFALHLPVQINPDAPSKGYFSVNEHVRSIICKNKDMYVLGINRGERNLLSIAVTAPNGTIVEQRNLNIFDGFNYREKLAGREAERQSDRQAWRAIREIKNIKSGYLSRAIGEIVRLVKKYNCIIAMENLDLAFRSARQAFEKNVYQQFEADLITKLGLLMDKNDERRSENALQLTNPNGSVSDRINKAQNGIVLFMNPAWISMTDPLTGFVNRLDTRFKTIKDAAEMITKFDTILYNNKTGRFEFCFRYGQVLTPDKEAGDPSKRWIIQTYGERIENVFEQTDENQKGKWVDKHYDITAEFKKLLSDNGVDYEKGRDIIPELHGKSQDFWKEFLKLLRLTLQLTNWDSEKKEFSVRGCTAMNGKFYDTDDAPEGMPKDADALAAWNIARKAHIVINEMRASKDPSKVKMTIDGATWLKNVQ